jgi:hypothetical protein
LFGSVIPVPVDLRHELFVKFMQINGISVMGLTIVEIFHDEITVIRWDFYVVTEPILSTKFNEVCVRFFLR